MEWFTAPDYWLTRLVFQRALAVVYLVAFCSTASQFRPLIGARGMLPVPRFVAAVPFRHTPSVFHFHYSDRFFATLARLGCALSAAVAAGAADVVPLPVAILLWCVLWVLYLSVVNVGQTWYAFGWETLLLETGFLAVFLGNADTGPPTLVRWLLLWLLFRVEFGAGLIKLRGDRCWRRLTCLDHHHLTQPMPGPLSWFFHRLPKPLHRVETAANHVAQLLAPVLLFTPQPIASVAAGVVIVTQLWLVASGNFAWLNWLTIVLAVSAVDGTLVARVLPVPERPSFHSTPVWYEVLVVAATAVVVGLSYQPARNLLSRRQSMNRSYNPVHLVNAYGAFGTVSRTRHEVVLEGTDATELDAHTVWYAYEFKGKPGDVGRRPPLVAPYHLRLDWMMWFAATSPTMARTWFAALVSRLLTGDRATLRLLRHNPFPSSPPRYVRARLYHYRFSTVDEKRATGDWWRRDPLEDYLPPVDLETLPRVASRHGLGSPGGPG